MKTRKVRKRSGDVFAAPEVPANIFRAGDVTELLGIERWRLEKFLTGTQFKLSPSGHLGTGKGSWRLFSQADLYRLAIASQMVEDGFTAKFVSMVLEGIWENELQDFDELGKSTAQDVGLFRTEKGPVVGFVSGSKQRPYYVIELQKLITSVNNRIKKWEEK